MKTVLALLAFVAALAVAPAHAADVGLRARPAAVTTPRAHVLPFPRGERAQAVWAERACWSNCQSYCTWEAAGCLKVDAQGRCLMLTDRCDRYCQRECRTQGGPLLGLLD